MSLLKMENGDGKLDKVRIDFRSELEEMCLDSQKKMEENRSDFRAKLKSSILVLKNEIDQAALMEFMDTGNNEIDHLQKVLNEMIRELENCDTQINKKP